MELLERRVYRGPSLYAHFPVMRLTIDLGALEAWPSAKIPGFVDGLLAAIPSLETHTCSFATSGGFVRRLREDGGTWLGHVLEHVAIELQQLTGANVSFGKTRGEGTTGLYHVVYEYEEERVGEAAGNLALELLHHLLPADLKPRAASAPPGVPAFDFQTELVELIDFAQRRQLGPSTGALVRAAEARDIPWMRLNDYSLVQFGQGKYQKRIQATVTSETRHIAVEIASDKEETNRILGELGLPGAAPARRAHRRGRGHGRRAPRLPGRREAARRESRPRRVARSRRTATRSAPRSRRRASTRAASSSRTSSRASTTACSSSTASSSRSPSASPATSSATASTPSPQLVDIVNTDPRRGIGHEKVLTRHRARRAGRAPDGAATDVTHGHGAPARTRSSSCAAPATSPPAAPRSTSPTSSTPTTARWRSAQPSAIGLDVCGVDFITADITRELPRGRRRHLRGQRGARLPHARRADRGQAARRRRPGDGHALPARRARADPDRGRHRHQRQDDDRAGCWPTSRR